MARLGLEPGGVTHGESKRRDPLFARLPG